ncbi:MutL C terminal dimerization domain [Teratosphaeria destructans]|uniref:MutL C terminal dimerization domain n=1 Tax=Teratosphaeria destructans TaxID=418781 RepID=A0A9W7SWM9_9PEZI|nr:MutL C terminal dimerization domain [Teratosphaeria destructans]
MSRIRPLPSDAIAQIHSSKHITSLQEVVCALLENSLDAGSTKVEISIDFRRGSCTVEDNGSGILPGEFDEHGGLGKLYHSSKCYDKRDLHGSTGTYLASLGALSLLSITSRHSDHSTASTLTLHTGRVIERRSRETLGIDSQLTTRNGTQVAVRDLFGNMPVRVKQRALSTHADPKDDKAWHQLKRGVVALLLAWPKPCAVRLRDCNSPNRPLHLSPHHQSMSGILTEKHLDQLAGKAIKADMRDAVPIVFQAGLAAAETRNSWVAVRASSGSLSVRGLICLTPAPTKQCQFVSIGVHPCSPASGHNALFDVVNKTFANSSFGVIDVDSHVFDEADKVRRRSDRRYKSDGYTQKQLRSQKGVDHSPMFILQLKLKEQRRHHVLADNIGDADLKSIVDLLEATMLQWLTVNHFRPRRRGKRRNDEQQGPASAASTPPRPSSAVEQDAGAYNISGVLTLPRKRGTICERVSTCKKQKTTDVCGQGSRLLAFPPRPTSAHHVGLSHIKSGRRDIITSDLREGVKKLNVATARIDHLVLLTSADREKTQETEEAPVDEHSIAQETVTRHDQVAIAPATGLSSDDFGSVDEETLLTIAQDIENTGPLASEGQQDKVVQWIDPITKQSYRVNARTGVVLPARAKSTDDAGPSNSGGANRQTASINTTLSSARQPLSLARRAHHSSSRPNSSWLPGFLKDWNNPVFTRQDEQRIPIASFDGPGVDVAELGRHRCTEHMMHERFAEAGARVTSKLSKGQLEHVKVIRQVDQKFILCVIPSEKSDLDRETLILVDQHAASERVILEGLLQELCAPPSTASPASALSTDSGHQSAVQTILLERPPRFQLSAPESQLFAKHATHFARWGILYELSHRTPKPTASQVRPPEQENLITVRALPPGISERCTLAPNILIDLLRSEIWRLASGTTHPALLPTHADNDADERPWLSTLGSCPKGILDMLNSRACRSAIMFNDVLSKPQCEELLADLRRCAFPFMCAHGRVSMVPVVELGGAEMGVEGLVGGGGPLLSGSGDGGRQEARGFSHAFRRWRHEDRNLD